MTIRLVLVLLGALGLGGTAELLGAVLPLLACRGCEYCFGGNRF